MYYPKLAAGAPDAGTYFRLLCVRLTRLILLKLDLRPNFKDKVPASSVLRLQKFYHLPVVGVHVSLYKSRLIGWSWIRSTCIILN